jgi:hypothetical protein
VAKKEKNPANFLVNNVPFQATQKELVKLFGSFGRLQTVWLPKKFDGTHQGFAFVEYLASKDAVDFVCQIQFVDGEVQKEGPGVLQRLEVEQPMMAHHGMNCNLCSCSTCCLAVWSFCFKHFYFIQTINTPFFTKQFYPKTTNLDHFHVT